MYLTRGKYFVFIDAEFIAPHRCENNNIVTCFIVRLPDPSSKMKSLGALTVFIWFFSVLHRTVDQLLNTW